jgi:hypothetical protein
VVLSPRARIQTLSVCLCNPSAQKCGRCSCLGSSGERMRTENLTCAMVMYNTSSRKSDELSAAHAEIELSDSTCCTCSWRFRYTADGDAHMRMLVSCSRPLQTRSALATAPRQQAQEHGSDDSCVRSAGSSSTRKHVLHEALHFCGRLLHHAQSCNHTAHVSANVTLLTEVSVLAVWVLQRLQLQPSLASTTDRQVARLIQSNGHTQAWRAR